MHIDNEGGIKQGVKATSRRLKVAIIAPPWLAIPVKGYGGIELVIQGLVNGLRKQDVEVHLFANGARKISGVKTYSLFDEEQFGHIYEPYFESAAIVNAHLLMARNEIVRQGDFDIIHDHTPHLGPVFWALATQDHRVPPVLHTFHGPPFKQTDTPDIGSVYNSVDLEQLKDLGRVYVNCISDAMAKTVPSTLTSHLLKSVHNALSVDDFPVVVEKQAYFVTLARFAPYKGQHIAIKTAIKLKKRLRMAGTVADMTSNRKLLFELANPLSQYRNDPQFRYYSDKILPYVLRYPKITYSGNLSGAHKMKFLSEASALLFPVQWEEPFGMAVIEALACGTPVVAMRRGAMSEIITHGVNGFLADSEKEFIEYASRVDEIDPLSCRASAEAHFSAGAMARKYYERYKEVIRLV